jgi:hypothetical protein
VRTGRTVGRVARLGVAAAVAAGLVAAVTGGPGGRIGGEPAGAAPATAAGPVIDRSRIPTGSAGSGEPLVMAANDRGRPNDIGASRTVCAFSHMNFDDPIVAPGRSGASHLHVFFGNTKTDASSTADSLATTGNSTCRGGILNRSAYWAPALIDTRTGVPIVPEFSKPYDKPMEAYYKSGYRGLRPEQMQPLPRGLRMIAGDARATGPQAGALYATPASWSCDANGQRSFGIPSCPVGGHLTMDVSFPQCGDGRLDSPDHKSHMAYVVDGKCPATHSKVIIPEITVKVHYLVHAGDDPSRWRLSSDMYDGGPGGLSAHADWFDGWDQDTMRAWTTNCLQASRDCGSGNLGDGRTLHGEV